MSTPYKKYEIAKAYFSKEDLEKAQKDSFKFSELIRKEIDAELARASVEMYRAGNTPDAVIYGLAAWLPEANIERHLLPAQKKYVTQPYTKTNTLQDQISNMENAEAVFVEDCWEMSDQASAELFPLTPTNRDLSMEFARALRNSSIEFSSDKSLDGVRHAVTASGTHDFRKLYAKAFIDRDDIFGNTDLVRGPIFQAARLLAAETTKVVEHLRCFSNRHRGYSTLTVRCGATPVSVLRAYGEESRFAAYDHKSDRIMVRLCVRFAVTP